MDKKKPAEMELFKEFVSFLKQSYDIDYKDIRRLVSKKRILIPISIFNRKLGVLEAVVKFLKQNLPAPLASQVDAALKQPGVAKGAEDLLKKGKGLFGTD